MNQHTDRYINAFNYTVQDKDGGQINMVSQGLTKREYVFMEILKATMNDPEAKISGINLGTIVTMTTEILLTMDQIDVAKKG